jgi:hypothetical protein
MNIEINPNESTIITFEVEVDGSETTPTPRLVVPISESGVSIMFEGQINGDKVEVDIADLLEMTNSTEFQCKLEVVVEDSIFVPWEENIVIKRPTQVKAKTVKSPLKESKVKVSAKTKDDPKPIKAPIMEVKKKSMNDMFFGGK